MNNGHKSPGSAFDPSVYPRTYVLSIEHRIYWVLAGLFLGAMPLLAWKWGLVATILATLTAVPMGGRFILAAFRYNVILEPDAITVREVFSTQRLLRTEIAGRRTIRIRGATRQILIPRIAGKKPLSFPEILRTDSEFSTWFEAIPKLDV